MEFKHGDCIEYQIQEQWKPGVFVALSPTQQDYAVHLTASGYVSVRKIASIRKPKVKKEGWVSVYPHSSMGNVFETKELALANRGQKAIDTIKIEWEE